MMQGDYERDSSLFDKASCEVARKQDDREAADGGADGRDFGDDLSSERCPDRHSSEGREGVPSPAARETRMNPSGVEVCGLNGLIP